jgi:hypothetical protein
LTRKLSRRNITIVIILIAVFAASMLLLNNNKTMTVDNQSKSPSEIVAGIERDLINLETRKIGVDEFKEKNSLYFHKYYAESYFSGIENASPATTFAINTTSPQEIQISKPYMNSQEDRQTVFVKIPEVERKITTQYKVYSFAKEGSDWKVLQVTQRLLSDKIPGHEKLADKYINYNGAPIEYHNLIMK